MSWQAASMVVLAVALLAGFTWYERDRPPARILALVATLAALAVVGRLAFAAVPNVKPTTDIVLFAGYALGAVPGYAVGAVTALVSNVFLSQGPWTPWQMVGWGAVGIGGAVLAKVLREREPNRVQLAAVCGVAGLVFGAWMDLYQWTLAARQDLDTYLALAASSLPYNLAHALGNVIFCLLIGPVFIRALRRYRRRLDVRWPAHAGAAPAGLVLALVLVLPAAAAAATPAERAERWLLRAQNADGGFGGAPGQSSSPLFSGWSGLGLAAAGHNPRDVRRDQGRSLTTYLARGPGLRDVGEVERTILLLEAAGLSSRRFRGTDLVAAVERRRRRNGSIAGFVSYTAFGVLALRAAGEPAGGPTVRWLVASQNPDGGFGVSPSSPSDSDMTGAVLQALAVVGRARGGVAREAVAWLRANQNADGGFGQMRGRSSNAQSTSYAVQGLVAARAAGATHTRSLAYLRRLQGRDGSVAYSVSSTQTPVWVTAQALLALERRPLPLATVPREPRRPQPNSADGEASAAPAPSGGGDPAPKQDAEQPTPAAPKSGGAAQPAPPGGAPAEEPPAPTPHDGGLRVDSTAGEPGDSESGGVSAWVVGVLVAAALGMVFLLRRRLFLEKLRGRLPGRSSVP